MSGKHDEKKSVTAQVCASDVLVHPNYTGFFKLPYDTICRRRLAKKKRRFAAQMNREINHMIAMKIRAIDGIRLDALFSIRD